MRIFPLCNPAAIDLYLIIRTPFVASVGAMSDARDRAALFGPLVKYKIGRYARVAQGLHVESCDRHPHAVVLETGLVAKSLAVLIDDDITIGRHAHDESRFIFGKLKAHGSSD